jgi:hypothetical protein
MSGEPLLLVPVLLPMAAAPVAYMLGRKQSCVPSPRCA